MVKVTRPLFFLRSEPKPEKPHRRLPGTAAHRPEARIFRYVSVTTLGTMMSLAQRVLLVVLGSCLSVEPARRALCDVGG